MGIHADRKVHHLEVSITSGYQLPPPSLPADAAVGGPPLLSSAFPTLHLVYISSKQGRSLQHFKVR